MRIRELLAEAAKHGVSVHIQHLDERPELLGYYSQERAAIVLRIGLTMRETRCALAHEIAHVELGHTCSTGATEHRARARSASMMIDSRDYALAEAVCEDIHQLADELDVTTWMVRDYQRYCLRRFGERTYEGSKRVYPST